MATIQEQVHRNAVALISLLIAVSSLGYNTWRNETSEAQRNIRHAAFRVPESLGEIQEIADYRYYYLPFETNSDSEGQLRISGFGEVAMVRDLAMVMPAPAPAAGEEIYRLWGEHVNALTELSETGQHSERAQLAEREITAAVQATRKAVLSVLKNLE